MDYVGKKEGHYSPRGKESLEGGPNTGTRKSDESLVEPTTRSLSKRQSACVCGGKDDVCQTRQNEGQAIGPQTVRRVLESGLRNSLLVDESSPPIERIRGWGFQKI